MTTETITDIDSIQQIADALRQPFTGDAVGKLPRVTCPKCRESRSKVCEEHAKRECEVCGNYMTTRHIHLDYVGHAEVTDRLLSADPTWNWEPMARDVDPALLAACMGDANLVRQVIESSPPKFERSRDGQPIGLWIRLTIGGITRLGFGSVEPGKFEAEKQLIGDALRNAAMRFGVALSLWSKGQLESEDQVDDRSDTTGRQVGRGPVEDRGRREDPVIGQGQVDTRPLWQQMGYADEDEYRSTYDSLQDIIRAISSDQKGPIRTWLVDHGYTMPDPNGPNGAIMPRQLPVRRGHVTEYSTLLKAARDASSRAAVGLPTPSNDDAPTSPEGPTMGGDLPVDPTTGAGDQGPTLQMPQGITDAALDDIIADVKLMSVADLGAELTKRSLPKTGNKATLCQRLTLALANEWVTTHAKA